MLYVITTSLLVVAAEWVEAQNIGDIRLVNDPKRGPFSGRLEVFIDQNWGTICSKGSADLQAVADTACRQLGIGVEASLLDHDSGTVTQLGFPVAPKSTPIHFGSINCGSSASDGTCSTDYYQHLLRCAVNTKVDTAACTHNEDIAIYCSRNIIYRPYRSQLTLLPVNGKHHSHNLSESSGGLVVFLDSSSIWKYGVVCGRNFDKNAADTACRQLGYTNANYFNTSLHITNKTYWDAGLNCKLQSYSCLKNCFSKTPTNRTSCTNVVYLSCEFDLSLKDTESAGSPRLCDASVDDNCKNDIEEYSFSVPTIIVVLIIVALLAGCATCITLLVCYLVPGCPIHRKRSGYKSID